MNIKHLKKDGSQELIEAVTSEERIESCEYKEIYLDGDPTPKYVIVVDSQSDLNASQMYITEPTNTLQLIIDLGDTQRLTIEGITYDKSKNGLHLLDMTGKTHLNIKNLTRSTIAINGRVSMSSNTSEKNVELPKDDNVITISAG